MKKDMIGLVVESYRNGHIESDDASSYVGFIRESNLDDDDDVDVLTEMVEVLQEMATRPVTADTRLNYWNQMIDATKNKIAQKLKEIHGSSDVNQKRDLEQEISKLRANLKSYQGNISQIKTNQENPSRGVGLRGTFHTKSYIGASAGFTDEELDGMSILEHNNN